MWYGTFKVEAWDRFFYNEQRYDSYSAEDIRQAEENPFHGVTLNTADGKKRFEEEVERFQRLYPGALTREGEKYDFNRFYAKYAITKNADVSKYDKTLIEDLRRGLQARLELTEDKVPGNKLGKKIGTKQPNFLQPKLGKALF